LANTVKQLRRSRKTKSVTSNSKLHSLQLRKFNYFKYLQSRSTKRLMLPAKALNITNICSHQPLDKWQLQWHQQKQRQHQWC